MTPDKARAREDQAIRDIEAALEAEYQVMIAAIIAGAVPREAAATAAMNFGKKMAAIMRAAEAEILGVDVSSVAPDALVGNIKLSARLYAESLAAGEVVNGITQRHAAGFQDARKLALDIFEGYEFRPPGAEPIKLSPRNERLPKYLREALLSDNKVSGQLTRAFARVQVEGLATQPLRAAYSDLLKAIDNVETDAGAKLLKKRIDVAFYERMRYFASRIARTELHRTYAKEEAKRLIDDPDLDFVQIRRAPGRAAPCICALLAGRDLYGLGPGVYPKAIAPVPPFHPFCVCVQSPRLDLTGRTATERDDDGDAYFLRRLSQGTAARVMGSQSKRDQVMRGRPALEVINATRDPVHQVRPVG